jgi:hypothetical protein
MDSVQLFLGLVFGSVGLGYFVYGKKQGKLMALIAGVSLCIVPYAVSNPLILGGVGLFLIALPFIFRN